MQFEETHIYFNVLIVLKQRVSDMTTALEHDGIKSPIRLRNGKLDGYSGTFWAWPVDGYFDLHHAEFGINPDGSDVVRECFATLEEVKQYVREIAQLNKWGV